MANPPSRELDAFFEGYTRHFNDALRRVRPATSVASLYTEYFLGASPHGVVGGENAKEFEDRLEQGFEHYRRIGTQSLTLLRVDATRIDDLHAMAKVSWRASYVRPRDGEHIDLEFENVYLLQNLTPQDPIGWRVFAFITGDEQALYREHGLT